MPELKPKTTSLRMPKPKKKLGLAVPPALRLPHDDLITALEAPALRIQPDEAISGTSMPSQTSQSSMTRHTPESAKTAEGLTMPSLTSQTRHSKNIKQFDPEVPIAPQRDFTKVANSINREAVPAGLFTGKSKQLYDCLYSLTRGAITPTRTTRLSRPKLMEKAHIGSRVTFDANIERLVKVGLIAVKQIIGEHEGNEYTVYLPEEIIDTMPSQTSQTSLTGPAQNLDRLVRLETSQTRHSVFVDNTDTSTAPKTSFKTSNKFFDDEAFAEFVAVWQTAAREITGRTPEQSESRRWRELAELLTAELKIAAARTTVSSVPAFFTEHLRRRLWKLERKPSNEVGPSEVGADAVQLSAEQISRCPDCGGTGFFYPQGYDSGVARCPHERAAERLVVTETQQTATESEPTASAEEN